MAVTFRSYGQSDGSLSATCVVIKPVGLAVDDLMVAQIGNDDSGGGDTTAPGGWTGIRQDVVTNETRSALFWKIAVQADVDATDFTFTPNASLNLGVITAWTGHDTTTPINANNGQGNGFSTTVTSPGITPSVANCEILLFVAANDNVTCSGYAIATDNPASWNERYDILTLAGTDLMIALGSATRPETSATGNGTATLSAPEVNTGQLVAIAPAAVGWASGDVNGVDIATIAEINGIALADIAEVNGVA